MKLHFLNRPVTPKLFRPTPGFGVYHLWAALATFLAFVASGQVKDYRELKYSTLPKFEISKPTIITLQNGLRVYLLEDHELPLVRVTARIRTGSNYEPADGRHRSTDGRSD